MIYIHAPRMIELKRERQPTAKYPVGGQMACQCGAFVSVTAYTWVLERQQEPSAGAYDGWRPETPHYECKRCGRVQ